MSNKYIPQIDIDKDTVFYELRRFLELASVGNPNVLELLYLPDRCIIYWTKKWDCLLEIRKEFLTKRCYETYSGYARSQLKKATGLNKKFNYEKEKTERKDIIDFCNIIDRETGLKYKLKDWLKEAEYTQEQVGLVDIDGFRDCYKLYIDEIKWVNDNHRFEEDIFEDRNYKDYQKWLKNRNESRVATNKKHGQQFDGKNIMHLVRLIMTAKEIPTQYGINVDRTNERDYLLSIKNGEVDLKKILEKWGKEAEDMKSLYDKSVLKERISKKFISNLELKLRDGDI